MNDKTVIKLFIVDDHQILIDGVKSLLKNEKNIQIVGEALNAKDALNSIKQTNIDILITDINMPEMSGIELTRLIKKDYPGIKIVALTMHDDMNTISEILEAGVSGYILKNTGKAELMDAIYKVVNNETYYSSAVTDSLIKIHLKDEKLPNNDIVELTTRESEILKLIAQEYSNQRIAEKLFISERTVETHRKNIFRKTNTQSIVGLIKYAYKHKLI